MSEITIKPVGPRFIAVRADKETISEGGIHLPQQAVEKDKNLQPEVIVIRVSDDLKEKGLEVGTRVLLNHTAQHQEFTYKGTDYVMVDWATVKGIYEV